MQLQNMTAKESADFKLKMKVIILKIRTYCKGTEKIYKILISNLERNFVGEHRMSSFLVTKYKIQHEFTIL